MMFPSTADSVFVLDGDYHLLAEWSLADDFASKQNPKGKEECHIYLNCNEQMEREGKEVTRIKEVQEKIKACTGLYPHEAIKTHLDQLVERDVEEVPTNCNSKSSSEE